jgi:hypothetical protein
MGTPYDRKIFFVYWKSSTMKGFSIRDVATQVKEKTPNVAGVMLKTSNGVRWQEQWNLIDPKAINRVGQISRWVAEFDNQGLEVHVWGVPRGLKPEDIDAEARHFIDAASVSGVKSLLLDVEHGEYYWKGEIPQARRLMELIRDGIPADTHIGLILDGRKNRDFSVFVDPFVPFVDSLHPMVYPVFFGRDRTISDHLDEAFRSLTEYDKPLVPMLQSFYEATRRPTAQEIVDQAHLAFTKGGVGISYYRLGSDLAGDDQPHVGDPEYAAIASVEVPPAPTEEVEPRPYTWQNVINAMATVAARNGLSWQRWFNAVGLSDLWNESLRQQPYSGPEIIDWSVPELALREDILELLGVDAEELARLTGRAIREAEREREAEAARRRKQRGAIIGMHGAPGIAAPPHDTWDAWIDYLKQMGVRWYKQIDNGDPNDTGPGSIFKWVLRLKEEGLTPIIRYMLSEQFPDRLPGHFFSKMQLYAQEGIIWAEIGNEPNLEVEWKSEWHSRPGAGGQGDVRVTHTDPGVIATVARVWVEDAEHAIQAGVQPAFYAFAPTDWRGGSHPHYSSVFFTQKIVKHLAENYRQRTVDIFDNGGWIAVHAATYEQPLEFDPFGQGGVVWDMTLRSYEVVTRAFEAQFGGDISIKDVPIMSTEGGVFTPDSTSMIGHDRLRNAAEHADRVVEMFKWLEENSPLQAMCPWCISVGQRIGHFHEHFRHDGWIQEINGILSPLPVVESLYQLKLKYERDEADKTLLDVPYISQWDDIAHTHNADCGPACMAMIINAQPTDRTVTVDHLYEHLPPMGPFAFTSIANLQTIGQQEGVPMQRVPFTQNTAIARTKELVEDATPFIALVNYAAWDAIVHNNFSGGHFVVVTGIDDEYVYIHDPLFRGSRREEGEYYAWTHDLFMAGWGSGHDIGNPDFVAIVPDKTVNFVDGD